MFHVLEKIPSHSCTNFGNEGSDAHYRDWQKNEPGVKWLKENTPSEAFPALTAPPGGESSGTTVAQPLQGPGKDQGTSPLWDG